MHIIRGKKLYIVVALGVVAIVSCTIFGIRAYPEWRKHQMVAMLKRSVDEWNEWRDENREAGRPPE